MNPILRRILAIIAIVMCFPMMTFLSLTLGLYQMPYNLAPILAALFFLIVIILFIVLKMDERARRKMTPTEEAILKSNLGIEEEDGADTADEEADEGVASPTAKDVAKATSKNKEKDGD